MPSKPLPKPVSARTLQRKYSELAEITHGRIDTSTDAGKHISALLHQYLSAFSNLYGLIPLRTAWKLVCELEPELTGQKKLLKKDFIALCEICRVEDHSYHIIAEDEIWLDAQDSKTIDCILANKKLIGHGYYRFHDLLVLMDSRGDMPYLLLDKKDYPAWSEPDHFRKSSCARDMLRFLEDLRVSSDSKNRDTNDRPIHGKTLNKFIFWHRDENFSYECASRKWEKEAVAAENNLVESEKLMRKIERYLQLGDPIISANFFLHALVDDLEEVGVRLNENRLDKLIQLFTDMNNKSHRWCNRGWSPEDLSAMARPDEPPSISFGPGLQAAFANGDMDQAELERMIRESGFRITTDV